MSARKALVASALCTVAIASNYQVALDYGTFQGSNNAVAGVDNYLGIPYAHAARFDHAYLYNESTTFEGVQDATDYGPSCPQQELKSLAATVSPEITATLGLVETLLGKVLKQDEDCLSVNVQVPSGTAAGADLPVLFWIHGGGFSAGGSATYLGETSMVGQGLYYQGANIVQRSVEMGKPIIFVSINYRLNSFGLSGGKEILDAGVSNLSIEDQRQAMRWVQKYIAKFGGSKEKVTIWGESAGSWSVSTHLVLNDGDNEGLFRGAIGFSGGPLKVDDMERQQGVFDDMAAHCGCDSSPDVLKCLREAPYEEIYASVQRHPFWIGHPSLACPWFPRPDGVMLKDSPHRLVAQGKIADVALLYGDVKDEGTLFALVNQLNVTTDAEFKEYFKQYWWPNVTDTQMDKLMELYPADSSEGSPFDTGALNALTPQFKRLAALIGDASFQAQRRQLLDMKTNKDNVWSYQIDVSVPVLGELLPKLLPSSLTDLVGGIPALGSFHATDVILYAFGLLPAAVSQNTRNIMSTIISFVATLDPNKHGLSDLPDWPVYGKEKNQYLFKEDGPDVIVDDYRKEAMDFLNDNADSLLL